MGYWNDSQTMLIIQTRTGRAGIIENIVGEDLDVSDGGFLHINLTSGGNQSTPDDTVEGDIGRPLLRNVRFSKRVSECRALFNTRPENKKTKTKRSRLPPVAERKLAESNYRIEHRKRGPKPNLCRELIPPICPSPRPNPARGRP